MTPQSVLIQQPVISMDTLMGACSQMFDHNVAEAVDRDQRKLADAEKFLSVLEAMRQPGAPVGLPPDLLGHVTFSVLTVGSMWDMLDFVAVCSGLPQVLADTKERDIIVVVTTGTLGQWRDAVALGCSERQKPLIRESFNQIHSVFVSNGLTSVWRDFDQRTSTDQQTFLLIEHDR
jgi:hypothetical protein